MEQELNPDRFSESNADGTEYPRKDSGEATASGGATDIFGTVPAAPSTDWSTVPETRVSPAPSAPPVPSAQAPLPVVHEVVFNADSSEVADPLRQLLRSAPPAPKPAEAAAPGTAVVAPNGGFTQLLRALNQEQAKPVEAAPAAPASIASSPVVTGSITQLLQTIESIVPVVKSQAAPVVETTVEEAIRVVEERPFTSTPQRPIEPTSSGGQVTSFQQKIVPAPIVEPKIATQEESLAAPVSFTQLFSSLDVVEAPKIPEARVSAGQGGFTQIFEALGTAKAPAAQPEVLPPAGTFTQMFQTLNTPTDTASSVEAPNEAAAVEPVKADVLPSSAPESFTQMFSTPAPQPVAESGPPTTPPASSPATSPGSFTQMFRALDVQPAEAARAEKMAAPGTFTQMFGTLSSSGAEPPRSEAQPAPRQVGSFTQLFGTLSDAPSQAQPAASPVPSVAPPDSGARASELGYGTSGASQIFSTQLPIQVPSQLSTQQSTSDLSRGPSFSSAGQPPPAAPVGGGLTQLLRTLDQTPQPPASPQTFSAPVVPAPTVPPVSAGLSEFTRILNASMLRESALRGEEASAAGTVLPAAQPSSAPAMGFPPVAMPPVSMPAVPQPPAVPQIPPMKAPEAPKPATPVAGKMQQMLPLLLILIIFLLIAVLVAVIILMKH